MDGTRSKVYSSSRPGTYSKVTSKITGLLGATLGLPGAEFKPLGNANCEENHDSYASNHELCEIELFH